jgi:hypothetical protein
MQGFWDFLKNKKKPDPAPVPAGPTLESLGILGGYCPVNNWRGLDHGRLAGDLAAAGLNLCEIEFVQWFEKCFDLQALYRDLPPLIEAMRKKRIWTWINLANANSPDQAKIPLSAFTGIVDAIRRDFGTDWIILQGASEWPSDRSKNHKVFGQIQDYVTASWAGRKSWNKDSRPAKVPAGFLRDWHPFHIKGEAPKTRDTILNTDTSTILVELAGGKSRESQQFVPSIVKGFALGALRGGFSFHIYHWAAKQPDAGSISACGEAVREFLGGVK